MHLRTLQPLALHLANSIFLGDYLTAEGQAAQDDLAMLEDNGFVVLGSQPHEVCSTGERPAIRRRGAGTGSPANA